MYERNNSIDAIALQASVASRTVKKWLKEAGIEIVNKYTPRDRAKLKMPPTEELTALAHLTTMEIAKRYGVSMSTVSRWCRKYSIALESQTTLDEKLCTPEQLRKWYLDEHKSLRDIAKIASEIRGKYVDAVQVRKWLIKYKIPTRRLLETRRDGDGRFCK